MPKWHEWDYVQLMRAAERGKVARGSVPRSEYWLLRGRTVVGRLQIRHKASGRHHSIKSHLYYEIRSKYRSRGYGTKLFELGLPKARAIGLKSLLIASDTRNLASQRIIIAHGRKLIKTVYLSRERIHVSLFKIVFH